MSSSTGPTDCERLRSEKNRLIQSGYNKGTIRGDIRYLLVSRDVRRHRLISRDYITTLPVTAEVASSSLVVPAIPFKHLRKAWLPGVGTNRNNKQNHFPPPAVAV